MSGITSAPGAMIEIQIDNVTRTWRDVRDSAMDAATRLKRKNIKSEVKVIDHRNGTVKVIDEI